MQRCELTRFQMRWCFLSEVALLVDCQVAGQRTTKSMLLHHKEIFFSRKSRQNQRANLVANLIKELR